MQNAHLFAAAEGGRRRLAAVLASTPNAVIVKMCIRDSPRTGRKHQIRVHLAYIGFPVVGDHLYGRRKDPLGLDRHFLHAAELSFRRPSDDENLHITAELPDDLQAALARLSG